MISLSELQEIATELIKANGGGKLIGALLVHLAYEYGPCYPRDIWKRSKLQWQQFVRDDVQEFIKRYVCHLKRLLSVKIQESFVFNTIISN